MSTETKSVGAVGGRYLTYMLGVLFQKLAAFALIPIYTARLSPGDYGALELLSNFVGLAALVVALGVPGAINKCYHRDCTTDEDRRDLVSTSILFTGAAAIGIAAIALFGDRFLAATIFEHAEWAPYVRLSLLSLAFMQTSLIPLELMRTVGRAVPYVGWSLFQMMVQILVSVWLLTAYNLGVEAVLLGNLCGFLALQLGTLPWLVRHSSLHFSMRHLRALAAFGLLLAPVAACGWIINVSDRFFLQRFANDLDVGLYALGYKFGMLIELALVLPFQKAWNPYYFSIADAPHARSVFARTLTYYAAAVSLGVALLSVCGPPLLRLMAQPVYHPAQRVIPYVAVSYALSGLVMCLSTGLIVSGKTRLVTAISVLGAAVNVGLNLLLIPAYGMMGAAVSTLLTFAFTAGSTVVVVSKHYPVQVESRRLATAVACAAGLALLASAISLQSPLAELILRAAVLLLAPLVLAGFGFFSIDEVALIRARFARVTGAVSRARA